MEGRLPRAETQVGTSVQRTGGVAFDADTPPNNLANGRELLGFAGN
jgi:hypothetical protein